MTLKQNAASISEQELIAFCREQLAHFKAPRKVVFAELPKNGVKPPALS